MRTKRGNKSENEVKSLTNTKEALKYVVEVNKEAKIFKIQRNF